MAKQVSVDKLLDSVPEYIQKVKCDTTIHTKPFKCGVLSCENAFMSLEEHRTAPFKFHNFPSSPMLCLKWKSLCGLDPANDVSNLKVCSDHFALDDYVRNYKQEFLNKDFKRQLKPDACPNQNLGTTIKRTSLLVQVKSYNKKLEKELSKVTLNNEKLRKIILDQTKRIHIKAANVQRLRNEIRKKMGGTDAFEPVLSSVFSKSQIRILQGKEKVYWSDDDMARAFTLRHIGSKKCYLYMKNVLNYPLPALSAVQKWAALDL